jgi:RimJ/RimL family protein N-acetyltransferase
MSKQHTIPISLRPLEKKDMQALFLQVNHKVVGKYLERLPYPYTKKHAAQFIAHAKKERKNKCATLGYWLGKNHWGKKYMSDAIPLVLAHAFKTLKLHRVSVSAFAENEASLKLIQNNGFKQEGIRRERYYRFGRWHDLIVFGLLQKEYLNQRKQAGNI